MRPPHRASSSAREGGPGAGCPRSRLRVPSPSVGFTFRKSLSLPGGFRLNLGKGGVGASWGVKGFRVGTGPRGPRLSVSLPGTGLGWSTSLGGQRAASTQPDERAAPAPRAAKGEDREQAAHAVAVFEEHLAALTSLHKEASHPYDWHALEAAPAPAPPADVARWEWWSHLAHGINSGEREAYEAALEYLAPFRALPQFGAGIEATAREPWFGEARFVVHGPEIVPAEALSLTPTGKLSTRKLGVKRSGEVYQDHVASAAIRVARELLALLPFQVVIVHARVQRLDTATGRDDAVTVLSAAFPREDMAGIDFDRIDPSDALERLPHAMDFSTRSGFAAVDEIGLADLLPGQGEHP